VQKITGVDITETDDGQVGDLGHLYQYPATVGE
jgi:hypothetical protein